MTKKENYTQVMQSKYMYVPTYFVKYLGLIVISGVSGLQLTVQQLILKDRMRYVVYQSTVYMYFSQNKCYKLYLIFKMLNLFT